MAVHGALPAEVGPCSRSDETDMAVASPCLIPPSPPLGAGTWLRPTLPPLAGGNLLLPIATEVSPAVISVVPETAPGLRLRGRRSECEALDRVIAGARAGNSQVLVVRGEAGVGKSALLQYLLEQRVRMSDPRRSRG